MAIYYDSDDDHEVEGDTDDDDEKSISYDFEQHCNIVSHLLTQKISLDAQILR